MTATLHVFGVRHHGPGSAASLDRALDGLQPDVVLIEGPPEGNDLIKLASAPGMKPPLAILTYPKKSPDQARFYPFAEYSPEWRAMRWANRHQRSVSFIDLPGGRPARQDGEEWHEDDDEEENSEDTLREDPLSHLAAIAGQSDAETWWNSLVEQSVHTPDVFEVIADAMVALRENTASGDTTNTPLSDYDAMREAYMRLRIREAMKQVAGPVAVVCGAWHVPGVKATSTVSADRALLKGYKPPAHESCWIPWTDQRLAAASGYRAGIISPGWYRHLWQRFQSTRENDTSKDTTSAHWQTQVARLLRDKGYDTPTASVIEATRLCYALAAVRGLPVAGLQEMRDASLTALCHGEFVPLQIIETELVGGNRVGTVDKAVPQPPLQADLARWQRKLRLKPQAVEREVALDLRTESGMAKSTLLHRLILLDVPWGELTNASAGRGTFRELWRLEWQPEFSVKLAEAVIYGPTLERATAGSAIAQANDSRDCAELAQLIQQCLLANLPTAMRTAIERLQEAAVSVSDVTELMRALPSLVDVRRYGTARTLPEAELGSLIDGLTIEVCIGLRYACHQLDDDAAAQMQETIVAFDRAIRLMDDANVQERWSGALTDTARDAQAAARVRGQAERLMYDHQWVKPEETASALSFNLSPAVPVTTAGAWLEGFVAQSGDVFLLDRTLLNCVDDWMSSLTDDAFTELLPMLRRAFANFDSSLRRQLLTQIQSTTGSTESTTPADDPRAATAFEKAQPLLYQILGIGHE